ncbi:MAG TPA: cell division protein FtsA [Bacteroidales bacterium]|jgi:cell division protein FtsA|nr:cell division protein FtsA [Bacteroidales bacterium]MDD4085946.1 cell division protein FtsA [Bacteroidales bacterium]MDY0085231.1 cell division protein FtsA [Bacteroidales bacterium]HPE43889.1 cell division protein FtsA [Bacteroidales bacterium]
MKTSDIIVGLDIGTTKIACLVGRKNENGKIEILGHGKTESIGVKRGLVSNIEDTVNSIRKAVDEAAARSGVDIKYVNVGIAGQHIKSLQHRGSLIRENSEEEINRLEIEKLTNDMYKLSMSAGEEIIDVIPQEYIVDGEQGIKHPVGMLGSKLEANFHVIIGQTAAAKNVLKCVKRAGLEMVDLILEPIASAEAVLGDDEKEAGVVLVDIGGGTTDIAIFHDRIIRHTAVIPFGGDIITEDIREGCTIIKKHAEEVKVKFGSSLASENRDDEVVSIPGIRGRAPKEISFRNLASIIQARLEEIFEHVHYEIKNSGFERKLIAGIVLTGGGSLMRHIDQLAAFVTGMDVRIGYPNEHLAKGTAEELASPMYATGIGLVIEGISRHLNEEEMEKLKAAFDPSQPKPKQKQSIDKKSSNYLDKIKKLFDRDLIE